MIDAMVILGVTIFVLFFIDLSSHRKKVLKQIDEINHKSKEKRGHENASCG